jgi:hypothetical protein
MVMILDGTNGIRYPGGSASQAYYEEGTFTAYLRGNSTYSNTSPGAYNTTLTTTGSYIKSGKLCYIDIFFDVSAYGNYVFYQIDNLPFTAGAGVGGGNGYPIAMGHQRGIRFVYSSSIVTTCTIAANVGANSTTVNLQTSDNTQAFSGWYYVSNQTTGMYIHVAGCYATAS